MTEEEKSQREKGREMARTTLEDKFNQNVVGANLGHKIFGEEGEKAYSAFMGGKVLNEKRIGDYNQRKEYYKALGVVAEPSIQTDGDISAGVITKIGEMLELATIGDLEKIAGDLTGKKIEVPEKLREYYGKELFERGYDQEKKKFDKKRLSEDEQAAWEVYENITSAFRKGCARNVLDEHYLDEEIEALNRIKEKYTPRENSGSESDRE